MKLRWIQISDWHQTDTNLGDTDNRRQKLLEDLATDIGLLRGKYFNSESLNFAVFNGDIANKGKTSEFQQAKTGVIQSVLDATGVSADNSVVVAGNHDLDASQISDPTGEGIKLPMRFFQKAWLTTPIPIWEGWLRSSQTLDQLRRPFQAFRDFAKETFQISEADWVYPRNLTFGTGKDKITVDLVCFNSALYCQRRPSVAPSLSIEGNPDINGLHRLRSEEYGDLFLGEHQRQLGLKNLSSHGIYDTPRHLRIAVLHHPTTWFSYSERIKTRSQFTKHFDFVLTGHEHEQRVIEVRGTQGNCIFVPAGASYDKDSLVATQIDEQSNDLSYNITELDTTTGKGYIYLRRWDGTKFTVAQKNMCVGEKYEFQIAKKILHKRRVNDETPEDTGSQDWQTGT